MKIENLELKLLKSSKIEDGDIILVKISNDEKNKLSKDEIKNLYSSISSMLNKKVGIYFFPANLDLSLIKQLIQENSLNNMIKQNNKKENHNESI